MPFRHFSARIQGGLYCDGRGDQCAGANLPRKGTGTVEVVCGHLFPDVDVVAGGVAEQSSSFPMDRTTKTRPANRHRRHFGSRTADGKMAMRLGTDKRIAVGRLWHRAGGSSAKRKVLCPSPDDILYTWPQCTQSIPQLLAEDGNIWHADLYYAIVACLQRRMATKRYIHDVLCLDNCMHFLVREYPRCEQRNILFQHVFYTVAANTGSDGYIYAWK